MRFSYREYVGQYPGTSDYRLILRPVISIRVVGSAGSIRCDALVDTGADETLLPLQFARLLGIDLSKGVVSKAAGISGEPLAIQYGEVELQIDDENHSVVWSTWVGFVDFADDEGAAILGHGGCLDYFTAAFDGENAELTLTPNSILPRG